MNNRHLYWLTACLFLLSLGLFLYKVFILKYPVYPASQTQVWDIEVKIHFTPGKGPVKVQLYLPRGNNNYSITDEQFISPGYGLGIRNLKNNNRQAIWTRRNIDGEQVLYYRATVRPQQEPSLATPTPPSIPELVYIDAQRVAAETIVAEAKSKSADVESFVREIILYLKAAAPRQGHQATILLGSHADTSKQLEVATQLLAIEKIPSRIVNGIQLTDFVRQARQLNWLEVYHEHEWRSYDPSTGLQGVPENYLPWWRTNKPLVRLAGGSIHAVNTAISRNNESALTSAMWREKATRPILREFSLLSLPLDTQAVYRVLLLVPIGVLLLVVLRNIIGIKTFGTFMPVLIAMAFRETQLLWGIILFTLVVGMGLVVRFYLEQLKLLLVPRLASVLITVIISMLAISIFSHKLGIHYGLSVALFPMVILTMTIERMNIIWEERGARESLQQGAGSLIVASLAYLLMNIDYLQYLLFIFPELLLTILAITLLLGRYSGYRLLELYRFKELAKGPQ